MEAAPFITLLIGLVIGAAACWFVVRARQQADQAVEASTVATARAEAERARADAERARAETSEVRVELATARTADAEARSQVADAHADRAEAIAQRSHVEAQVSGLKAERDAALARVRDLSEDTARMVDQFKVLSNETLERQGRAADQAAQTRMEATTKLMEPVTALLKDFQTRLNQVETDRATMAAELKEQVRTVTMTSETLRRETNALATALRKPQVRGAWGELQLKRAVEIAGMLDHVDFTEQQTTTNATDATIRPDLKVMFGDEKFVYVDSKVPLSAFLDAHDTTDERERSKHLQAFARNVRGHVDQLSAKEYWKATTGSPEFVVMFVPNEALFAEALAQLPDLQEYALQRGVVLANPSTLIGLLKTVAYSWKQAALAENAAAVLDLGRELHSRLSTMGSHFDKLGRAITSSVKAYNETVGSLEARVYPTARKMRDLKVTDQDELTAGSLDQYPSPLTAPELVSDAQQVEPLVGRERRAEQLDLFRQAPSTEELIDSTQPRLLEERRRTSS